MFMLARTDSEAPKHKGISYFLVDMKSPGVTVRPLYNLANTAFFSEVFFDNVRVPAENLVGEENRGWYIGTTTLDFERSSIGSSVGSRQQVETLIRFAKEHQDDGQSTIERDPSLKYELSDRLVEANIGKLLSYRVVTMQAKGMVPNYEASITKLFASELNQRIARTGMKVAGLYGQILAGSDQAPARGRYGNMYMQTLASTIAGGTSEIQRNIIATRGLGLPRD
jgi:alkylation response protein AidB-like acyl-CoA dehydrogenase